MNWVSSRRSFDVSTMLVSGSVDISMDKVTWMYETTCATSVLCPTVIERVLYESVK